MPAIARVIAHVSPNPSFPIKPFDAAILRGFALFCGTGVLALPLLIAQDLDIGTGFF
jgi:hypothetical protein